MTSRSFDSKTNETAFEIPTVRFDDDTNSEIDAQSFEYKRYDNNTSIDWALESARVPQSSAFATRKWLTIIASALCTGYLTSFIDLASAWLNDLKKGLCFGSMDKWSLLNPYKTCPADEWYDWSAIIFSSSNAFLHIMVDFPIYLVVAAICCYIAALITIKKAPMIKQSGIPEVKMIISGFNYNIDKYLGLETLLYKTASLILVVASGLWLGKEGPLVHLSCCVQNILYSLFIGDRYGSEAVRRELLSAAAATGISVSFNAPIGGVLFVLEGMPSYFMPTRIMWSSFVSATIAVVVLGSFKVFAEGKNFREQDLFSVEFGNFSWLFMEVVPFVLLGVMGGFYGFLFNNVNLKFWNRDFRDMLRMRMCEFFKRPLSDGKYLHILVILALTTIFNFPLHLTRLPLSAYLKILFTDCSIDDDSTDSSNFLCKSSDYYKVLKLSYILLQGFLLTTLTYGIDIPGGILMPTLVLGATFGRLLGIISQVVQKKINFTYLNECTEKTCVISPSSYAVIGASTFMSGLTKYTMCVVVIMFELTGAVSYVLPIMIGVVVSKFVNDWLSDYNIYDSWLIEMFNRTTINTSTSTSPNTQDSGYNMGKGSGFINFSNLTTSSRSRLPDLSVSEIMIQHSSTKCLYLIPQEPYTANSLLELMNEDNHEGYPVLLSHDSRIYIGYVYKRMLIEKISSFESLTIRVCLKVENTSSSNLSQMAHYENSLGQSSTAILDLPIEKAFFIINEDTPVYEVVDLFESMHINYLVVQGSSTAGRVMCGFIDRFKLASLIESGFENMASNSTQDGIRQTISSQEQEHVHIRNERQSIELLT